MTANRYKRPSTRRDVNSLLGRVQSTEYGNPRPTFRATITDHFDDLATERRAYTGNATTDTVFWDYWDPDYNPQFFDITIQSGGVDDGRLAAVDLMIPGIYAIRATIDWAADGPTISGAFNTWIGSNYDDGGLEMIYEDLTSDIIGSWTLNQFRIVWSDYESAEQSVEITAAHDDAAEEPLYIPGGIQGYWGAQPYLTICYLGGIEGSPTFTSDADAADTP